ncbi:unnamed protein product [Discula destructiva]
MAPKGRRGRPRATDAAVPSDSSQSAAQATTQAAASAVPSAAIQTASTTTTVATSATTQIATSQTVQIGQHTVRRGRAIRGPQSALTDFLASHNISANQIRSDYEQRRQLALASGQQNGDDNGEGPSNANAATAGDEENEHVAKNDVLQGKKATKRKRDQQKAIDKIKASKNFQREKKNLNDSDEEDEQLQQILKYYGPQPGQMANCAECDTRFTVTPYSRAGPDGGLLCNPCGKALEKVEGPVKKKKQVASGGPVGRRRKNQSNMLDGTYTLGAKSLMSLCIETLAKNIHLADDLGELPETTIDKIARLLSKKRLVDPNTLRLFLQPTARDLAIYDASRLKMDDLISVFQSVPSLKSIKIKNAVQFKDQVMEYLLSRDQIKLEGFHIHGANLLSSDMFKKFLTTKGKALQRLQVYYTDKHFDDECLALLKDTTPSLKRFKVSNNQMVSGDGIRELASLKHLQHLSTHLHKTVHPDIWVEVLGSIGAGLKTLSLRVTPEMDNTVLDAIHNNCRSLTKLRITDSEKMTDAGFTRLFTDWHNPSLKFIDLQKCRYVDSQKPRENSDDVGLCSEGFKALMAHSGQRLQYLNIHACRHISGEAFEEAFGAEKIYLELKELEISFCEAVTDFIVGSIFRSCPNLRELNVFGCMNLKNVRVPRGKILVGMPNALGMMTEGQD